VFVMHFESGGTFLDLDPAKAEAHFREALAKGPACA
ncbi:MAG: GTPase, partial [Gemmatimonadaceae bacterium]|nr:GTPase [Gemmatimonadaceae bacterium]